MHQRIALIALALLPVPVFAQDTYPSHPITMVVAFPPGGVADIPARPTAFAREKALKQRVIIENRPGAPLRAGMARGAHGEPGRGTPPRGRVVRPGRPQRRGIEVV